MALKQYGGFVLHDLQYRSRCPALQLNPPADSPPSNPTLVFVQTNGKIPFVEGQSYGVIPPGTKINSKGKEVRWSLEQGRGGSGHSYLVS